MSVCREYFSRNLLDGSRRSARETVRLLWELVRPGSVVDVGCGTGSWLAAFEAVGVRDLLGIDGAWADRKKLEIPPERFRALDLRKPFELGRQFELVLCLEVAQHLPQEGAKGFVDSLARLGPAVLFSA